MCLLLTERELEFCSSCFLIPTRNALSQSPTRRPGTCDPAPGCLAADGDANTASAAMLNGVSQLSLTVRNTHIKQTFESERLILARGFRGFSPWLSGAVALRLGKA